MGFYDRHILPILLNGAMSAKPITYQRKKVVPKAEGRVLEIGFGAGHNLPFYDASKVTHLWALEPELLAILQKRFRVDRRVILQRFMLRDGVANDLVIHVRDVHYMFETEAGGAKPAPQDIDKRERAEVADMGVIVNGWSAGVHADPVVSSRGERL